nr:MAG TPA: large terminase [Caudoviricetes sp.]
MPLTEKQVEYLQNCSHRWNVKTGATGSGKSFLDFTVTIPKRIVAARGEGLLVLLGNTRGTLERNILEPMRQWWPGQIGIIRSDNTVELFGKKVYALGADNKKHVSRIQGATFEYVYGDEVTTWSEDVFQMLKSRLRCEHSHFDGTCNPDNPEHWFKKFLDSDADIYQQSYVIDDGVLPSRVVEELKKEYTGTVYYDRYILGLWCQADGLIYKFGKENIVDDVPESGEYYISCDYGTLNPFSAGLWCWDGKNATRIREYYYSGRTEQISKTDEEYYTELEKLAGDLPVRSVVVDPSAASFIEVIRRHRRFRVQKAVNDVVPGIVTTSRYIQDGTIKVHRSCKDSIREFGLYRWDDKSTEDKPIKENDHAMDDIRYFVMTILRHKVRKASQPQYIPLWGR